MRLILVACSLLLAACDGAYDDLNVDAGPADSGRGPDGCPIGSALPDASINVPTGPCDPATGGGCSGERTCIWQFDTDQGACECLSDAAPPLDEPCGEERGECGPGLACLLFEESAAPACFQVCSLPDGDECAQLDTAEEVFLCFALTRRNLGVTERFGVCAPVGRPCDVLQDDCASDESCTLISSDVAACTPAGDVPLGGDCSVDACVKGAACASLVDQNGQPLGTRCYEPCDLNTDACSAGTCTDVGSTRFGLCI